MDNLLSLELAKEEEEGSQDKANLQLVLNNHQILEKIFSLSPLKTLKNSRLVCKQWDYEAARKFNCILIRINPHKNDVTLIKLLSSFLTTKKLPHTLMLSFLDVSWASNELNYSGGVDLDDELYHDYVNNQMNSVKMISTIPPYLKQTFSYIRELRLEMNFIQKQDSMLFGSLISGLSMLKRLSLDVVSIKEENLAFPVDCVPVSLKTVGFRIHIPSDITNTDPYSYPTYKHLMRPFKNVTFIDLDSWHMLITPVEEDLKERYFLRAIKEFQEEKRLPNLKGIKLTPKEYWPDIQTLPVSLTHLSLHCEYYMWQAVGMPGNVEQLLDNHKMSLKMFNIYVQFTEKDINQVELPQLPMLETFVFTSRNAKDWGQEARQRDLDWFNFRSLFIEGRLELVLPSLHTLCILHPKEENDQGIWNHIFPNETKKGEPLEIPQIENLMISLVAECDTSHVSRFQRIFPSLKTFRHLRRKERGVVVCHHQFNEGSSVIYNLTGNVLERMARPHMPANHYEAQVHNEIKPNSLEDAFFWY